MMSSPSVTINDVERWNDTFALEHDIDDYYTRASLPIRMIEHRRLTCIRKMVDAKSSDRILEVGCGGGHILKMFPNAKLTGVDVSGRMLDKARRNLRGYPITLLKGELNELDLESASFDKIICSEVLEHVVDPHRVLGDIRRLLRPGGRAVITFPNDSVVNGLKSFLRRTGLTVLPLFRRISWGGDQYHLHVWNIPAMRELLSRYFAVKRQRLVPARILPIRCCFQCVCIAEAT